MAKTKEELDADLAKTGIIVAGLVVATLVATVGQCTKRSYEVNKEMCKAVLERNLTADEKSQVFGLNGVCGEQR